MPQTAEQPKIHNIDLERIQSHLYRGKYLTPQDFLDDLQKIVHNARAWGGGERDNERFAKAQMMYTAAQVHTNELDAFFRAECDRMAVRERKRREEWAAANPKPDKNGPNASEPLGINGDTNGTSSMVNGQIVRRSARHNGEQSDIVVIDPVKLERRLKRCRSSEASGSQDEKHQLNNGGLDAMDVDTDGRAAKKPRTESEDSSRVDGITTIPLAADDDDPLDLVGPTSSQHGSGGRSTAVRFSEEKMETHIITYEAQSYPRAHVSEETTSAAGTTITMSNSRDDACVFVQAHTSVNGEPSDDVPQVSHHPQSSLSASAAASTSVPSVPDEILDSSQEGPELSQAPPSEPSTMEGVIEAQQDSQQQQQQGTAPRTRSPSPEPPPPFHVSEDYLEQLSSILKSSTEGLSIEQLEQLRATCLNCVYKRRSDWNRDELVGELLDIVRTFVGEAMEELSDD